jgi:hypothetical protein
MTKIRLYDNFGSTKESFAKTKPIDTIICNSVSELIELMVKENIDPRDFKTYCEDTFNLYFCEKFVKLGVEARKRNLNEGN